MRVYFEALGDEYREAWAELKEHRTWDDALAIQEAADQALRGVRGAFSEYRNLQVARCVEAWTFDADPRDPRAVGKLDEHVVRHVVTAIERVYSEQMEAIEQRRKALGTG